MERGVKVKTSKGELGIVIGGNGEKIRIWIESTQKSKYVNPEEVKRMSLTIRK